MRGFSHHFFLIRKISAFCGWAPRNTGVCSVQRWALGTGHGSENFMWYVVLQYREMGIYVLWYLVLFIKKVQSAEKSVANTNMVLKNAKMLWKIFKMLPNPFKRLKIPQKCKCPCQLTLLHAKCITKVMRYKKSLAFHTAVPNTASSTTNARSGSVYSKL